MVVTVLLLMVVTDEAVHVDDHGHQQRDRQ